MATLSSSYQYLGRSSKISPQSGSYGYYILLYGKTVANNTTGIHAVSVKEILACDANSSFYNYNTVYNGVINGTTAFSGSGHNPSAAWSGSISAGGITYTKHAVIGEASVNVDATNGLAKDITLSCYWKFNESGASYTPANGAARTVSVTATLPAIPRASLLDSLTSSSTYFTGTLTYKYTPQKSNYYNSITFVIDNGTQTGDLTTVRLGQKATSQQTGTLTFNSTQLSTIYSYLPGLETGKIYAKLSTYTDSGYTSQIGSVSSKYISLTIPTSIKPTVTLTVSPINDNQWISGKGIYVQGFSGLSASMIPHAGQGSILTAESIKAGSYSSNTRSLSVAKISTSGTMNVVGSATDARTRTTTATETITVQPYATPALSGLQVERGTISAGSWTASEDGPDIKVIYNLSLSLSGYNNVANLAFKFNGTTKTPSSGDYSNVTSGNNKAAYFTSLSDETTWDMVVTATDSVGQTSGASSVIIPTSAVTMEFRSNGKGVAFGKTSEKDAFECAMDAEFTGDVEFEGSVIFATTYTKVNLESTVTENVGPAYSGDCWAKKDFAGLVELHLRFNAQSSGSEKVVAVLPEGYRPSSTTFCSCYNTSRQLGYAYINAAGQVKAWIPATGQTLVFSTFHAG